MGAGCAAPSSQTPPSPVTQGAATTTYTLADVAQHKDSASCWTIVRGNVYDVTTWIGQHPGGEQAIRSLCGVDGTTGFSAQHAGERRPENELASFQIGILKP